MAITVSSLHVYPVKGLKGIDLDAARCTDRGLEHDRRWMIVDADGEFMTQRGHPRMATVWTELTASSLVLSAPDMPELEVPVSGASGPPRKVRVWSSVCDALDASAEADAWLGEYLGLACRLVYMPHTTRRASNPEFAGDGKLVGFADGYAYLAIGEASLADLNRRLAERRHDALPMNRFRPNIVLRGSDAYAEDGFGDVRIGTAVLRGVKPSARCQVTTTDQSSGEVRGPEPLATLATYREDARLGILFGMNFVTVREGRIAVGDRVEPA